MSSGRGRQRRLEMVNLAKLVWEIGSGKLDIDEYIAFGIMRETGKGKPLKLSPKMQAMVDAEAEKMRANNPDLPKPKATM